MNPASSEWLQNFQIGWKERPNARARTRFVYVCVKFNYVQIIYQR